MTGFPDFTTTRPPWLMTLADLALLLLGFSLLVQASAPARRDAIGRSVREAFGAPPEPPMPVAAFSVRFAPGSAAIADPAPLLAWAGDAARDPRVAFNVTATTDGTSADAGTDGPTLLAADRARAVALTLRPAVPSARLRLATDPNPRGRAATVTLAFAGERP